MNDQPKKLRSADEPVRASEIDHFLYCERSWWYSSRGMKDRHHARMEQGEREHQEIARQAQDRQTAAANPVPAHKAGAAPLRAPEPRSLSDIVVWEQAQASEQKLIRVRQYLFAAAMCIVVIIVLVNVL